MDPFTGNMFGSVRQTAGPDLLIVVRPLLGRLVVNYFDTAISYVPLRGDGGERIDDLAIDPTDGSLIGLVNPVTGPSRLVSINRLTGATSPLLTLDVSQVSGLSFDAGGDLLALVAGTAARVVVISLSTGTTATRFSVEGGANGFTCMTNTPNSVSLRVHADRNGNGAVDGLEEPLEGIAVGLWRDIDANGRLDSDDILLVSDSTDADGLVDFVTASRGDFLVRVLSSGQAASIPVHFESFGQLYAHGAVAHAVSATANERPLDVPESIRLSGAYPNPFNPSTRIVFAVPRSEFVTITVHNLLGREVARIVDGYAAAGEHEMLFEADTLPSGVYLVRMATASEIATRTITLIR
jgi:hypothetical protein